MNLSEIAIEVRGLSKVFYLYGRPWDFLREFLLRRPSHRELWALKDISFQVPKGEMMGLIGRNGSGKSTLLKILTGVLERTAGEVRVQGRVSAILELGAGFHPDYTGRQNILLGGLCLGMSRAEIEEKLPWIIEFSELQDFIDQPLRTYSSGMKARLAFSTAIATEPEVLFVDEALSVGDAPFQRKCFDLINKFRQKGTTIVLVTHDLNTVSSFCDRALLLEEGTLLSCGEPRQVIRDYYQLMYCSGDHRRSGEFQPTPDCLNPSGAVAGSPGLSPLPEAPGLTCLPPQPQELRLGGRREAEVLDFGILDREGRRVHLLASGETYRLFLTILFHQEVADPAFGFLIRDPKGTNLFGIDTRITHQIIRPHRPGEVLRGLAEVTMWLTNGDYFLSAGIGHRSRPSIIDLRQDGVMFSIPSDPGILPSSVVNLQPRLSFETLPLVRG